MHASVLEVLVPGTATSTEEMLDATTATSLATATNNNEQQGSSNLVPSSNYSCNTCHVSFKDGQQQRIHMKEALQ